MANKHWCSVIKTNDGHDHPGTAVSVTATTIEEARTLIKRDYGDVNIISIEEADENFDADALYESLKEVRIGPVNELRTSNPRKADLTYKEQLNLEALTKYRKCYDNLADDEQEDIRVIVKRGLDVSSTRGQKLKDTPPASPPPPAKECKCGKTGKCSGSCKESKPKESLHLCNECGKTFRAKESVCPTCKKPAEKLVKEGKINEYGTEEDASADLRTPEEMFEEEKRIHPSFTDEQIHQLVEDHLKAEKDELKKQREFEALEGDSPLDRFKRRRADYIKKEYESYLQRSKEQNKKPMSAEEYASFLFDIAMEKMGEAKVNEFGKVQAKFGSVEWQDQMTQTVLTKLKNKQKLDDMERAFVDTQIEHIKRLSKEQGIPLPPGIEEAKINEEDFRKMPVIGTLVTKDVTVKNTVTNADVTLHGGVTYEVVAVSTAPNESKIYVTNVEYKPGVPQLIPEMFVESYTPKAKESIQEGMAQLVTEIPGLSDKDQEILDFYFEKHGDMVTPEYNEMIKALHGVLSQGRLFFAGITKHSDPETGQSTTNDKSTIASLYLLNVILPTARKEYLGFEPDEANEALTVDKASETDYRRKVLNFLAHPWTKPAEIEAVRTLKEFEERIRNEPVSNVQDYIKRYAIKYGSELTRNASPEFLERLRELASGVDEAIAPVATAQSPTPASGSKAADKRQIVASDLVDKADADRIAGEKKGKVVADEKDPKKWAVEVPIQA
jgi:ribosome assembly protein YihI (activator of Der GTPase)